jgi:hypothetical protein
VTDRERMQAVLSLAQRVCLIILIPGLAFMLGVVLYALIPAARGVLGPLFGISH